MKAAEIRELFLKYFEKNGHQRVDSSPLVPQNDPTLLFTNAGMVQFKDTFLGKEKRGYKRATTSQKCVRAGGKHNDLERVGETARHHTFFEMLGNFSFGDYFKKDAIRFAWDFVTNELKLPKDLLYVTVFEDDDEAAEIWEKQEGVPRERIFRFGEADNFWAMGETGPCGPCSEIFIDRGSKYGPKSKMGDDTDRFMEIWNLVFMQFNRDERGKLTPLPKPSVDTGAGLERIASVLQDVDTNYDTDIFEEIMRKTGELAGRPYKKDRPDAVSFRVIADHSRATAFLIGDGVLPSNEGRGYVLRRIMRRAIRHGKKLGFEAPFLNQTAGFVIDQMKGAYPDLEDKREFISKAVLAEEEQFFRTLERGLGLLDEEMAKLKKGGTLAGPIAFKLYDTYGFPIDLTRVILEEKGMKVDEKGFEKSMEKQKSESRKHWKGTGEKAVEEVFLKVQDDLRSQNKLPQFTGYSSQSETSKCLALFQSNKGKLESVSKAKGGTEKSPIQAIFEKTPFYGESGGQVGDKGEVTAPGFKAQVIDVQKPTPELIVAHLVSKSGEIKVGESYTQETQTETRKLTEKNHTATHLLHWALQEVLGKHVKQAGSLVTPELLRFDFTHFNPLSPKEIRQIEEMINAKIWQASGVSKEEMPKDEALQQGAIAFFGEKYGDHVRVVKVGDFSVELCGGTHVDNASDIHLFKIGSESGIAAGVRRIVAYTSKGAFEYLSEMNQKLIDTRDQLGASSVDEIPRKLEKQKTMEADLRKQLQSFQSQSAGNEVNDLIEKAETHNGAKLITGVCKPDPKGIRHLRNLSDRIRQKFPDAVLVLGMPDEQSGKAMIIAAIGPNAPKEYNANKIIQKLAPLIQGRGGGKPDMAQAGGTDPKGLAGAVKKASQILKDKAF